jgi:hypothetical protein
VHPTTETAIRELDSRSNDSIDVALLWNSQTNRVYVAVQDTRRGESLEFEADPADALAAFHHPDAYAGTRRSASPLARSSQRLRSTR